MARFDIQAGINVLTALILLVGGMAIVFFYPGRLDTTYRWMIGIFVVFYFLVRMGQTILVIRRGRRAERDSLHHVVEEVTGDGEESKTA